MTKITLLPGLMFFVVALLRAAPALEPGSTLLLDFPELGEMHDKLPAACEVRIPKTYDPRKPVPLLVWFGGGKGSHQVGGARGLVDFDRFVVVALPYPRGVLPRIAAQNDGPVDAHWVFQRAMLNRVVERVPNIDPRLRLVAGTSSGGHHIAYGLDRGWAGFADYFTAFIVHEGGAQPLTHRFPGAKGKRVLVVYGEESDSLTWRTWFNWQVEKSGAEATIIGIPGAGHGLNEDGRRAIRTWTDALLSSRKSAGG
jgi:pimeloyl-ACP methyl ester carboxylesterase